ncbi:hypothetical protein QM716_17995 [Rhodococcus sp. IEGM 1409]|uniref:hypothetical protein n=1 Tax=Rhodococcus sp. IEGM 1409 TaxID=3047082 RepID=UPI0024B6B33F|nr:hypothetical protein [Rhodococcus sp. IEGM 1409]MDI9901749.1 hypothetical protein [Rhodococcus sp. IEGM 1409]
MPLRPSIAIALLLCVSSGCTHAREPVIARPHAEIGESAVCNLPAEGQYPGIEPPPEIAQAHWFRSGTVPPDFEPAAAVTCDESFGPSITANLTTNFFEHQWEGDFTAAVAKLNAPSEGRRRDQGSCPVASMAPIEDLWLIDAQGRIVRPSYPVDECGFQQLGGLVEIEKLDEVRRTEHIVSLTSDAVLQRIGCGTVRLTPTIGEQHLVAERYSVSGGICRYSAEADGEVVFAGATQLSESFGESFAYLPRADACSEVARITVGTTLTRAEPGYTERIPVLIDVDGCQRISIEGHVPLQASPEIVERVA